MPHRDNAEHGHIDRRADPGDNAEVTHHSSSRRAASFVRVQGINDSEDDTSGDIPDNKQSPEPERHTGERGKVIEELKSESQVGQPL